MPLGHEGHEALPGRALEVQLDGVLGQPLRRRSARVTSLPRRVPTTRLTLRMGSVASHLLAALQRRLAQRDQRGVVELRLEAVVLRHGAVPADVGPDRRLVEDGARGRARAPSSGRRRPSSPGTRCGRSSRRSVRKPSWAISSRTSWATKRMKLTTWSASPVNFLRSSGSCVATPTGQVLRWQTRIMMQPTATSGAVEKPNSSAPSSAPDDHVAAGLQLAVGLDDDAAAQVVEQQHLVRLGQAQLPGNARVLDAGQRRGAGAAVVAADQHHVGLGLGHARGDGAHARPRPPA